MSELYVLKDGRHVGPLSKSAIARGMAEGTIPRDVYVAPPGAKGWLHASQMPELLEALAEAMKSVPPPQPRGVSLTGTLIGAQSPMRSLTPAVAYAPPSSGKVPAASPISAATAAATPVVVPSAAEGLLPPPAAPLAETAAPKEEPWAPPTWISWWIFAGFVVASGVEVVVALSRH